MMSGMAFGGEFAAVDDVAAAFCELVVASAPRSVALSGGSTAERCYERLAARGVDWSDVSVFFGDERFVPPEHPDSNEGMARRALLDRAGARHVYPMYRPEPIEAAGDRYDELVRDEPAIDLVHLGLGADGHTASLFPGSPALDEHERFVVATGDALHPHPRLTFTFPAIERARLVVVTVSGTEKRDALTRVREGDDVPGARIRGDRVVWIVNRDALGSR